jgi:hypothetical protein
LLFFALVAFGVGGLILTLAAKPIALDCAGKPHAMRMKRHIARVAKQYDALSSSRPPQASHGRESCGMIAG